MGNKSSSPPPPNIFSPPPPPPPPPRPPPPPPPPPVDIRWRTAGKDFDQVTGDQYQMWRYGNYDRDVWIEQNFNFTGSTQFKCEPGSFGGRDPLPGIVKNCQVRDLPRPPPPPPPPPTLSPEQIANQNALDYADRMNNTISQQRVKIKAAEDKAKADQLKKDKALTDKIAAKNQLERDNALKAKFKSDVLDPAIGNARQEQLLLDTKAMEADIVAKTNNAYKDLVKQVADTNKRVVDQKIRLYQSMNIENQHLLKEKEIRQSQYTTDSRLSEEELSRIQQIQTIYSYLFFAYFFAVGIFAVLLLANPLKSASTMLLWPNSYKIVIILLFVCYPWVLPFLEHWLILGYRYGDAFVTGKPISL